MWPLLLLAVALSGTACQLPRSQTPTPPPGISAAVDVWYELADATPDPDQNPIVEVWNNLSDQFVEKGDLDAQRMGNAAIEAMLDLDTWESDSLDKPGIEELNKAAIDGMLGVLNDPYSGFLDADDYKLYMENFQGEFEGIGARVTDVDGRIVITEPLEGAPAEKAGIRAGDVILEVDGASTAGWSVTQSVLRIRGPKGTPVELLILHQDEKDPVLINIVRDIIPLDSVGWEILEDGIAYIRVFSFTETTPRDLEDALNNIKNGGVQGIILDLRDNPGGLLSSTVAVASEFLSDGLVLYSKDGDGDRIDYEVQSGGLATDLPLVVLVNYLSASGSEVLAAALQDHGRAVLIGTRTYGKGSVNLPKQLSDGSGLYFTIARWYSPDGQLIEGEGLAPDFEVPPVLAEGYDLQLATAISYMLHGDD